MSFPHTHFRLFGYIARSGTAGIIQWLWFSCFEDLPIICTLSVVNLNYIYISTAQGLHFLNILATLLFFRLWWLSFLLGWATGFLWLNLDFYPSGPLCFFFFEKHQLKCIGYFEIWLFGLLPLTFLNPYMV